LTATRETGRRAVAGAWGVAGLALAMACTSHEEAEPKPVVTVKAVRAELADVRLSVRAPAVAYPRQQASLASRITAPIRELKARKGDTVSEGQVLALLESRDVLAQREDAAATLRQAQQVCDRREQLFAEGAIPQRELLASQTELAQARARHDLIEAQLRFTELTSPFAGVITEQFLYPGDMAKPETPVFTVTDLSRIVARAQVAEADAGKLRTGQVGAFHPTDAGEESFEGRVTVVNRAVDPARRTIEAWLEIPNGAGRIRAGAFGNVEFVTGSAPGSVVVPVEAVEFVSGTRKGSVLVVDGKQIAHRREVEAGDVSGGRVQILGGLKAGETVVLEGGYGLPDETEVRFAEGERR